MMNDRLRKTLVALMAVAVVGACDFDPPVDLGDDSPERLQTNPSSVAVNAGDTTFVDAWLQTALGQALLQAATYESCNTAIATTVADTTKTESEPGTRFGIVGQSIGTTCVVVRSGSFEDTVLVRVVAAGFDVTDVPDSIRAGTAGDLTVTAVNAQGQPVGPFTEGDATFTSSNTNRLFFTGETGEYDTRLAGPVNATVSWTSQGITRTEVVPMLVIPAEPDSISVSPANFGAVSGGDSTMVTVVVFDSIGNINRLPGDLLTITATSDDPNIATVNARFEEDPAAPGEFEPVVWATGVNGGSTTIDITLTATSGTFTLNNVPVTVVSPALLTITPDEGRPGELITITGTGLTSPGLQTGLIVGGRDASLFIQSATANTVTFYAPALNLNGDAEVVVTVGGVPSQNSLTYTQTAAADIHSPANEDIPTAPVVAYPVHVVGSVGGSNIEDFYRFVLPTQTTVRVTLTNDRAKDLEIFIVNSTFTVYACPSGAGATAANPETFTCTLAAGTYFAWVFDYDGDHGSTGPTTYLLQVRAE